MFVRSNEKKNYLFLCLCLFVDYGEKKYKELELGKLEYPRRKKKKSNTLKFCIYKKLELGKFEYCVAWNSSLPSSNFMWHFSTKKKSMSAQVFFMKLKCLKLDLQSKLEFHEHKFQKSGILLLILQTVVCS